jgi:hypothetical protein
MKRICITLLVCLLLTACGPSTPTAPDNQATIEVGVKQTLAAQANQVAIAQTVAAVGQPSQPAQTSVPAMPPTQTTQPLIPATPPPPDNQAPTNAVMPSSSVPKIEIISVPALGSNKRLSGRVEGVDPKKFGVAVYIQVDGGWWTKPYWNAPVTFIGPDGNWSCAYVTGGNDLYATAFRAYLIPIKYDPPTMNGDANLPSELDENAVATAEANR